MKKARLILSAIAVFAVIGGAYAVKASRFAAGNIYYYTTTAVGGPLTYTLQPLKTTAPGIGSLTTGYTTTAGPTYSLTTTWITTTIIGI